MIYFRVGWNSIYRSTGSKLMIFLFYHIFQVLELHIVENSLSKIAKF